MYRLKPLIKFIVFALTGSFVFYLGVNLSEKAILSRAPEIVKASANGELQIVRDLIQAGDDVDEAGPLKRAALHWAAYNGHTETIELLLSHQADIDIQDREEWTPLHFAYYREQSDVIDLLLKKGANPELKDRYGQRAQDIKTMNQVMQWAKDTNPF